MRYPRLAVLAAGLFSACATVKTPTMQIEGVHLGRLGVTGAGLDLGLRVQNRDPEPLMIESFDYELKLNGRSLGRGYHKEPVRLDGFGAERVRSRFNLNFLRMPGAIQRILDQDRAKADVKGYFYVREHGGGLKKLGFSGSADVDLGR